MVTLADGDEVCSATPDNPSGNMIDASAASDMFQCSDRCDAEPACNYAAYSSGTCTQMMACMQFLFGGRYFKKLQPTTTLTLTTITMTTNTITTNTNTTTTTTTMTTTTTTTMTTTTMTATTTTTTATMTMTWTTTRTSTITPTTTTATTTI